MGSIIAIDQKTDRKFYLDDPDDLHPQEKIIFLLNLHGAGSSGAWQRAYFPAVDYKNKFRLVIATPSAATKEPYRHWVGTEDDDHLRHIVEHVFDRYGRDNIASFWLVGHSQGGRTSSRLLREDSFFQDRVDGWLSLSGGRIGPAERAPGFSVPLPPGRSFTMPRQPADPPPGCDVSFIFAIGEHEITALPATSPWAEKYGAGPRELRAEVVDSAGGRIYDTTRESYSTKGWGLKPGPGRAEIYIYPNAAEDRVIADIVRLDKGHTEGLEPKITEAIIGLIAAAPGGKARRL